MKRLSEMEYDSYLREMYIENCEERDTWGDVRMSFDEFLERNGEWLRRHYEESQKQNTKPRG
jgi:hypothetical protein